MTALFRITTTTGGTLNEYRTRLTQDLDRAFPAKTCEITIYGEPFIETSEMDELLGGRLQFTVTKVDTQIKIEYESTEELSEIKKIMYSTIDATFIKAPI